MDSAKRSCGGRATLRACRPGAQRPCSRWSARRARLACNGIPCRAVGPIGIRCAPPDAARNGRALWKAAPRWRKGGRHSGGMLWGMGQMGPVLVSVSFTLNSVTKLNSVNPRARAEHLDTVLRAPACHTLDGGANGARWQSRPLHYFSLTGSYQAPQGCARQP